MARLSLRSAMALALVAVLVCGAAALGVALHVRAEATRAGDRQHHAEAILTSLLAQDDASSTYLATGREGAMRRWRWAADDFTGAIGEERALDAGSRELRAGLSGVGAGARAWQAAVGAELLRRGATGRPPSPAQAQTAPGLLDVVRTRYVGYVSRLAAVNHATVQDAVALTAGLIAAVAILLAAGAVALIRRSQQRERQRVSRLAELRELLQVSASEAESRDLLLRHVSRLLPTSGSAMLTVVDSEDRLEPKLGERVAGTPLARLPIVALAPGACLAIRLSRPHERGHGVAPTGPLATCEVCGKLADEIACEPLRVNRRTLGAVLVASEERLGAERRAQLHEAVQQSAPILAIQRNLEVAERRAASDPLTGLPNRRAADEAMRRLAAQAGRTISPLAAILVDLDSFKQVNDRHGHAHGDAALTALAQVLAAGVRASDFVARYGGEEFVVFAPDTDRQGAVELAEKLREAISQTVLPVVGRLTASMGVAAVPEDAVEPEQLLRRADRALYVAKALGRNRVQAAEPELQTEG